MVWAAGSETCNFQLFSTFRSKSAGSDVIEVDIIQKFSTRSPANSHRMCRIDVQEVVARRRFFLVIQDLRQGVLSPPPVNDGLRDEEGTM